MTAEERRAGQQAGVDRLALEGYTGAFVPSRAPNRDPWPAELFLWRGEGRAEVLAAVTGLVAGLERGARPRLTDLAYTLSLNAEAVPPGGTSLAVVASSLEQLRERLTQAKALLEGDPPREHKLAGVHFSQQPLATDGKVAFVFPGQGSQYVNMMREVAVLFPEVRGAFDRADRVLAGRFEQPLSHFVFPPPVFSKEEEEQLQAALTETNVAQPALGATGLAMLGLLRSLGVEPEMTAGHSYGELLALHAAGVISEQSLLELSEARGRFMRESTTENSGTMAAVAAGVETLRPLLADSGVVLANVNSPRQTVISGPPDNIEKAIALCKEQGILTRRLAVACAFHSPLVAPAKERFADLLRRTPFSPPRLPVFSNTTASAYPDEASAMTALLSEHLARPVELVREIEAMYEAGARVFVEVGPRQVLKGLVGEILADKTHVCAALDVSAAGQSGLVQLLTACALLFSEGVPLRAERLFSGRMARRLDLSKLEEETGQMAYSPTTSMVSGAGARPLKGEVERASLPVRLQLLDDDAGGNPLPAAAAAQPASPTPENQTPTPAAAPPPQPVVIPSHAATPAAPAPAPLQSERLEVMQHFQQVMQRFLQTQESVMLELLRSTGAASSGPVALPQASVAALQSAPPPPPEPPAPPAPPNVNIADVEAAEAEPAAAPVAEEQVAAAVALTEEQITAQLLAIVAARTGYLLETLSLDADLEADLGIDSIKRVEIVSTLMQSLSSHLRQEPEMEKLTASRSLREIVAQIAALTQTEGTPVARQEPAVLEAAPAAQPSQPEQDAQRFVLRVVPAHLSTPAAALDGTGVVLVLDDGAGVGEELTALLQSGGYQALRVVSPASGSHPARWASQVVADLHRLGSACALVDLRALTPATRQAGMGPEQLRSYLNSEAGSFFHLVQALQADLERSAAAGAVVLAATAMGGSFGCEVPTEPAGTATAWLPGFLKTLAKEWPSVRVKAVDLEVDEPSLLAARLLAELTANDALVEIGYHRDGRRFTLKLLPDELPRGTQALCLDKDAVVLVTGGARGITAEACIALSRAYSPTLLLVGRTPLPNAPETPETAALTDEGQIKQALFDRVRADGASPRAAEIESGFQELMHQREVRRTLARLQPTGARVVYLQCDVRDVDAFSALIDRVYATYGRLNGVIHGAGVIEDRLLANKTFESFRRVLETKVLAASVLAHKLRPDSLGFLVFFSSVSGRFGNRGQADYAAANEMLNKLAQSLDRQWPARVVAINWGPWQSGMASAEVQRHFAERGVTLIPAEVGSAMLLDELRSGAKGEPEVIIGGFRQAESLMLDRPPALTSLNATGSEALNRLAS